MRGSWPSLTPAPEAELLVREQEVFLAPPDRPEPQHPALALPREPEERRKLGEAAAGEGGASQAWGSGWGGR